MADRTKTESVLNIECVFLDGDTRTITLKHPRSNVSSSEIETLENFMEFGLSEDKKGGHALYNDNISGFGIKKSPDE